MTEEEILDRLVRALMRWTEDPDAAAQDLLPIVRDLDPSCEYSVLHGKRVDRCQFPHKGVLEGVKYCRKHLSIVVDATAVARREQS